MKMEIGEMSKYQPIFDEMKIVLDDEWRNFIEELVNQKFWPIAQETIPDLPDPRKQVLHLHLQYVQY